MRGKLNYYLARKLRERITPADAGKTSRKAIAFSLSSDHPRGCGENSTVCADMLVSSGSPPRMRGKRPISLPSSLQTRITPADAGKTKPCTKATLNERDHPRGCGENPVCRKSSRRASGSPPRMRGKHRQRTDLLLLCRITPADAGKTHTSRVCAHVAKDHPRGCGENPLLLSLLSSPAGSPPRMRGKPRSSPNGLT